MSKVARARREKPELPYRMKDLCDRVGLPRQAIHFYIKEGLVPEGQKTGRNTARYGDEHVERLLLVRKLQEERFLPLKAIKEIVAPSRADAAGFTPVQRELLQGLKRRFATRLGPLSTATVAHRVMVDAAPHLRRCHATVDELEELALAGLVVAERDAREPSRWRIAREDLFVLDAWSAFRQAGFTPARGFRPVDLRLYAALAEALVRDEVALLAERLAGRPADEVVEMLERALPAANEFVVRYHEKLARAFLARQ